MQRIFKYDNIRNTALTSDKQLNILIHGARSYVIICKSYKLSTMVEFSAHPVYVHLCFGLY